MALSDSKRRQIEADAAPVLMAGEQVIDATTGVAEVTRMGTKTRRRATILVTDRRVIIFSKKLGGYDAQDYAYGLLTGVDHKKGITGGHINLRASGDSANVQQVQKDDVERIAQLIRERMAVSHPAGAAAPVASVSVADELVKLAQLRDAGVLDAEEFAAQKAKLLNP
jgi:hypothetical protein